MKNKNIFPIEVYVGSNFNEELDKKLIEDLELSKIRENGNIKSNRGGFQTNGIINEDLNKKLKNLVIKHLPNYLNTGKYSINVLHSWINENNKGDFNVMHTHPGTDISIVYYVKLPKKEKNYIRFYRPGLDLFLYNEFNDKLKHSSNTTYFDLEVKENNLIIFPAFLFHEVPVNNSDEKRITVALNVQCLNA
jgi:uncharacterized protein (TIGR02466 family)